MSDGKIIYDVEVNDDGVESKVKSTNDKIDSAAQTGSSAFSEVWTGALRAIGGKLVELGQQAVQAAVDVAKQSSLAVLHLCRSYLDVLWGKFPKFNSVIHNISILIHNCFCAYL